ncbi:MAG: DUF4258 domain-containing protein [Flavobacterium sp.]|nr:MAG: DUF4258 domain-containing protein [Flavobacterium sp.]
MKFIFRLAYYLAGFAIGLVFVFFILNGKDASCSYFPNARVLKHLRSKPFVYSDIATQKIAQHLADTADVRKILTYGDVDFDQSNVNFEHGKLYVIEGKNFKNQDVTLKIVNYDDRAVLKDIVKK